MAFSLVTGIIVLALLVGAGAGLSGWLSSDNASELDSGTRRSAAVAWDAERIFVYALSLAGLVAALYGIAGLIATVVVALTQHSGALLSGSDVRDRTSYYLAALIVGAPLWLGLWTLAQRRAERSAEERRTRERRLYLAAIFATSSVVALFALHTVLRILLTLPDAADTSSMVRDGIFAGARLLVWGVAWLLYARLGWRERGPREANEPHDVAVYVLAGFSLTFLIIGLDDAVRRMVGDLLTISRPDLLAGSGSSIWTVWGGIAAWVLAGGLIWGAVWQYDLARGGKRFFRVLYLYLVLAVAVPAAITGGIDGLYELLRRVFGYSASEGTWSFLQDVLPALLIGGGGWAYHWMVLRRQAIFSTEDAGAIPWPRRPALAVLSLGGLVIAASAFTALLWLVLDLLLNTGVARSGGDWWRDQLSFGIAGGLVGGALWLAAWSILQRAAAADPLHERTAQARRRLLGLIVLAGALVAVGFTVALLWLVFRALLGGAHDASTVSTVFKDLSAALVALGLAAYHGVILRADRSVRVARPRQLRVLALIAPGAEEALAELGRLDGPRIEVIGYLSSAAPQPTLDPAALNDRLAALETQDHSDGVLLILHPDGGSLYPYTKTAVREAISTTGPGVQGPPELPNVAAGDSAATPA